MSRRKVIVKRLNAIQNLGAMDVLCTDKTGTLTAGPGSSWTAHLDVDGDEYDEVLEYAYLNSHFQTGLKNLLDRAVLDRVDEAEDGGRPTHVRRSTRSRSTSAAGGCRWSSQTAGERPHLLICKGAVEEVLAVCTARRTRRRRRSS